MLRYGTAWSAGRNRGRSGGRCPAWGEPLERRYAGVGPWERLFDQPRGQWLGRGGRQRASVMNAPPDDRSFRREMAAAYRSGWHFVDLATAVPGPGDSLTVTLFGEPVVVTRDEEEDVHAYRLLRRPRGAPQEVRCAVRYGMIFVNLDQRDERSTRHEDAAVGSLLRTAPETMFATPRSA